MLNKGLAVTCKFTSRKKVLWTTFCASAIALSDDTFNLRNSYQPLQRFLSLSSFKMKKQEQNLTKVPVSKCQIELQPHGPKLRVLSYIYMNIYRICSFEVHNSVFLLSLIFNAGQPSLSSTLAHFHHSRKKPSHSSRHWQLLAFSALWRCSVWTFHIHGIIHCVAFHGWLPPQIMLLMAHPCCITCQDLLFLTDECISLCGQSSSYLAVHQLCFGIALGSSMNNSRRSPRKRLCESVFLVLLEST